MKKGLLILGLLFLSLSFVIAADLPNYKDKYVNDFASVLSENQTSELRALFYSVDQDTSAEVVFVSDGECASKGGQSQYAIDLMNSWKVGKADKNNGLLILYCLQENKIWVSSGYGLEGILPDSKIGRLLDENYVPLRDSGNVSEGIIEFSKMAAGVIEDNKAEVLSGQAGVAQSSWEDYLPIIIWIILIIWIMIARKKAYNKSGKPAPSLWWIPLLMPGRGFGGGGGGFGGGGFGGGGGGGGGAGR